MPKFLRLFEEDEVEVRDADWLHSIPEYRLYDEFKELGIPYPDFNKRFWSHPETLFHATKEENIPVIQSEGLKPQNRTRGLSNRGVRGAVFTTSNWDDLALGSYGDWILEIDTAAMKRDGYTPFVSQEPDVEEAEVRSALAHRLGIENYEYQVEHGMGMETVIVHGAIPTKYLKLVKEG